MQKLFSNSMLRIIATIVLSIFYFYLVTILTYVLKLEIPPLSKLTISIIFSTLTTYSIYNHQLLHYFTKPNKLLSQIILGFILVIINYFLIVFLSLILGANFTLDFRNFDIYGAVILGLNFFIAVLYEEFVFRGILLIELLSRFNNIVAILVSSLIFAISHLFNPNINAYGVMNIFVAGVFLSILCIQSYSIYPAISFHFFWNFLQFIALGSPVSGLNFSTLPFGHLDLSKLSETSQRIIGGYFGIEEGLFTTLLLVTNIIGSIYLIKKYNIFSVTFASAMQLEKIKVSHQLFEKK